MEFYGRYAGRDAKRRITEAVGIQTADDRDQITKERSRLKARISRIDKTARNLLDNITQANRALADQRLTELTTERESIELQIDSPEHLALTDAEVRDLVSATARFVAALEPSPREGPLDEWQAAVRRCVDEIIIDRDERQAQISVRVLPTMVGGPAARGAHTVSAPLPDVKLGRPRKSQGAD